MRRVDRNKKTANYTPKTSPSVTPFSRKVIKVRVYHFSGVFREDGQFRRILKTSSESAISVLKVPVRGKRFHSTFNSLKLYFRLFIYVPPRRCFDYSLDGKALAHIESRAAKGGSPTKASVSHTGARVMDTCADSKACSSGVFCSDPGDQAQIRSRAIRFRLFYFHGIRCVISLDSSAFCYSPLDVQNRCNCCINCVYGSDQFPFVYRPDLAYRRFLYNYQVYHRNRAFNIRHSRQKKLYWCKLTRKLRGKVSPGAISYSECR